MAGALQIGSPSGVKLGIMCQRIVIGGQGGSRAPEDLLARLLTAELAIG